MDIDPGIGDHWLEHSGTCQVVLSGFSAGDGAAEAMAEAGRRLRSVPHPDEPSGAFVSYVSDLVLGPTEIRFGFDAADLEAYPELVESLLAAIVMALDAAGIGGSLSCGTSATRADGETSQGEPTSVSDHPSEPGLPGIAGELRVEETDGDVFRWVFAVLEPMEYLRRGLTAAGWTIVSEDHTEDGGPGVAWRHEIRFEGADRRGSAHLTRFVEPDDYWGETRVEVAVQRQPNDES